MYGIILATVWQGSGFYMALMLAGLKSINTEIWSAARLDGVSLWRLYVEIIIPMMKFTFLTCAILLSLGVVKAYDIVFAMTNGGPGQSTWVPAYFIINASGRSRISARLGRCGHHARHHHRDLPALVCSRPGSSGGRRRGSNEHGSPKPHCAASDRTKTGTPSRAASGGSGAARSPSSSS